MKFLNARPLLAGLEAGIDAPFPYTFSVAEPARCADLLGGGQAQVGLVPVAALPWLPAVQAYPFLGIAAQGETTSVLLVSRVPLEQVRILAAHTASRTSVVLARLLLKARYGVEPRVLSANPPVEAMLATADAAVVIGDPAMAVNGAEGLFRCDLAAEWLAWRGQPFVFALWGVQPAVPREVFSLLEASFRYAQEHFAELLPRWAANHGTSLQRAREYLGGLLRFQLGEGERRAVEDFLRLANEVGLLPARGALWCHD
ncbi:MAG: menaquinone biosynthesis protein [Thermoanaerobaculum sp.]|nr:menaquinone biosynthesis protein [Thermoanaerobaculum sp.]